MSRISKGIVLPLALVLMLGGCASKGDLDISEAGAGVTAVRTACPTVGIPAGTGPAFFWGIVASAITGVVAIYLVFQVVRTRSFAPFVVYRVLAGLAVLGIIISGFRPAT